MNVLFFLGWSGTVLSVCSLLLCFVFLLNGNPKHHDAPAGFVMFAVFFGVPGLTILWRLSRQRREAAFQAELLGYVKSLDSFTVEELSRKIGRTEMVTEQLVAGLIQSESIGLVFHRQTRQYLHRGRLQQGHHVLQRCPTCGANLGGQILFAGEQGTCQYCDQPLVAPSA